MKNLKETTLKNWDDVNQALKDLGELTMTRRMLENSLTDEITKVKEAHAAEAKPVTDKIKLIEKDIELFVTDHKDEFAKKRSKEFPFGSISYRVSKSIKVLSVATCIKALKAMGMHDYINVKETPNKDMLLTLKETDLAKVACQPQFKDNLTIAPFIQELKEEGAPL